MSAMLNRRLFALAIIGTPLAAAPSAGLCSPLPPALEKALNQPTSTTSSLPKTPEGKLSAGFVRAIDAVHRIRGDDDLKAVAALDVIEALNDAGHVAAARSLANKTPGYRGAVALSLVAQAAAERSQPELYQLAVAEAKLKLEPYLRTRRGQIAQAHMAAAYLSDGDTVAAEATLALIDLPDQKTLAEALCLNARSKRDGFLAAEAEAETLDENILRPVFLKKAEAILDVVERSLGKPAEKGAREHQLKLIADALDLAAGSRVNIAGVTARAAGLYGRMGESEKARSLLANAEDLASRSLQNIETLRSLAQAYRLSGDGDAVERKLAEMEATISMVPVTLRAKACASVAGFALANGQPAVAEKVLKAELERARTNPNLRIGALADCHTALCYARRNEGLPNSLKAPPDLAEKLP